MIFVSGDFNCPQIKWKDIYPRIPDYVSDFILGNSLIQCNGVPSNVCGNILDLLFVNDESKVDKVAAMDVDFTTDHTVLNFNILLKALEKPSVRRKVFNYRKTDVGKLCALLSDLPYFNTATEVTNIDAAWDTWLQHHNRSVSECVPQVNVRKSNAPPWFDCEVRHVSSKKNNVGKIAKASDLKED